MAGLNQSRVANYNNTRVWVVFEGRKPGIYPSWPLADLQVNGFKGQLHQAFNCYDEAVKEWRSYCIEKGLGEDYITTNIHVDFQSGSSSRHVNGEPSQQMRRMQSMLAEDTSSDEFIMQQSMQRQLAAACSILRIQQPKYNLHEVKMINGVEYRRYSASLATHSLSRATASIGRYGKDDYDAMEDVAALLLRRIMAATGKKIRDLNHYNVELLEEQLHKTMDENRELEMEISILNEEIKMMHVNNHN